MSDRQAASTETPARRGRGARWLLGLALLSVLVMLTGCSYTGIACPTITTCYVVGFSNSVSAGVLVPITNGTPGTPQNIPSTPLLGVTCPTSTVCEAVGEGVNADGVIVPIVNGVPGTAVEAPGSIILTGIACPTTSLCYAVGTNVFDTSGVNGGVVVPISLNGAGVPTPGTVQTVPGFGLFGIACPTSSACYAVGLTTDENAGVLVPITVGGNPPAGAPLNLTGISPVGIACPTSSVCYIVGEGGSGNGQGAVLTFNSGVPGAVHTLSGESILLGITCQSASLCYAVGVDESASGVGLVTTVTNGVPGTPRTVPGAGFLVGVACTSSTSCFAVGTNSSETAGVIISLFAPKTLKVCTRASSACPYTTVQSAIDAAGPGSTIVLQPGVSLSGPLTVNSSVTITGWNSTLKGSGQAPVITIGNGATLTLSGVTVSGGTNASGNGGGISNAGTLLMSNSKIISNSAANGGGIYNTGLVTLTNVTVSGNTATGTGGGIDNTVAPSAVSRTSSSVTGNTPNNCVNVTGC